MLGRWRRIDLVLPTVSPPDLYLQVGELLRREHRPRSGFDGDERPGRPPTSDDVGAFIRDVLVPGIEVAARSARQRREPSAMPKVRAPAGSLFALAERIAGWERWLRTQAPGRESLPTDLSTRRVAEVLGWTSSQLREQANAETELPSAVRSS